MDVLYVVIHPTSQKFPNYKTIALISHASKILLLERIRVKTQTEIADEQVEKDLNKNVGNKHSRIICLWTLRRHDKLWIAC